MADPEAVGKIKLCPVLSPPAEVYPEGAFVEHYYKTFDTNRAQLGPLYQQDSILTFEGQRIQGAAQVLQKLTSLPFQQCQHHVSSLDVQPSLSGGIIVFVTGQLLTEGESNPLKFSQIFHLAAVGSSFAVSNDLFRLNYA